MARSSRWPAWLTFATLLACGSPKAGAPLPFAGETGDAGSDAGSPGAPRGPHALWSEDPESLDNPFPDGRLASPDGGNGVRPRFWTPFLPASDETEGDPLLDGYFGRLGQTFATVSGFGNYGGQLVRFSGPVDAASLSAAFVFVRLAPLAAAEKAAPGVTYDAGLDYALVRPGAPLSPATPYALVLTSAALAAGAPLVRAPDFDAWAQGGGASAVKEVAAALSTDPDTIVFASFFTTEDVRHDLAALASWVAKPLPGALPVTVAATPVTAGCAGASLSQQCPRGVFDADGGVANVLAGWFYSEGWEDPPADVGTVVIGDVTLADARDGEQGHFTAAAVADPGAGRQVARQFVLAVPDPAKVRMPEAGWPMVVAGHGLGGGNSIHEDGNGDVLPTFCLAMAEFLAQNGYGCIGIDAPSHQSRGSPLAFFDLDDMSVTRDYVREMIFDEMQLSRLLASWPPGRYGVTIDPSRVSYVGQSMGSVEGASLLTLDPRQKGGVLLVPGGGLTDIVQSPVLGSEVDLLLSAELGLGYVGADGGLEPGFSAALPIVMVLAQAIVESADPINHAAFFPASAHALIDEGLEDTIMPNATTDALAAALGFPALAAPSQDPAGVNGIWKWDLAKYGLDPAVDQPHSLFGYLPPARAQAGAYLASFETKIPGP